MREETDMTVEETDMIYERRNYYWRGKTQSRNQKQPKKRSKHSKFKAIVRWYVDCLKISSSSMWLCFITPTFKLNSWEVMRLYPQRYSGWAVVTVVFPCSSNRNLQGWSSNKIRALHVRYTLWRTRYAHDTTCRSTACRAPRHTRPACFRGFLLSGMFISDKRRSSCSTLSDGKHNNNTL